MLAKNHEMELYIESLTAEGSGVGHFDGMAVFVAGALPGDTVRAHIIKSKKSYAIARIAEILTPSPHRIPTDCAAFPRCGGCAFRNLSYAQEIQEKKHRIESAFLRLAHMDVPCEEMLVPDATARYRNKAQYPVALDNGVLQIGFYASHSHRVIPCEDCLLQPVEFTTIVEIFRSFLLEWQIPIYQAESGKGLVRHLYLRKGFASGEIMVCVVINGAALPKSDLLVQTLLAADLHITSIVLNHNTAETNVILGTSCTTLWGTPYIQDILCGVQVRLSPQSFYQVNHAMAQRLYQKAAEFAALTGHETVLDLYCGTGLIGLSMAQHAKRVIGVEIIPAAVEDARENARRCNIENASFLCGDAKDAARQFAQEGIAPDVVLLDPPRKGCEADVLATVASMQPQRIVYISCDPATLARDVERLSGLGYTLTRLCGADLFPRTAHVESVALMSRK